MCKWTTCFSKLSLVSLSNLAIAFAVTSASFFSNFAHADEGNEKLGVLSISDLFIEPSFTYAEPKRGAFDVGNSFLAATWTRDSVLSATLKVGSTQLLGVPSRYGSTASAGDLAMIEAFAQADSYLGRVRAGLIPIPFGLEGGDTEERLRFPRSLLFRNRMINLRDQGVSYHISVSGFFSDWAIHNGEGGADKDGEMWFTARGGWAGARFFRAGFSASAGRTNPDSTNPGHLAPSAAMVDQTGLDLTKESRIRIANGFIDWEIQRVRLELEATGADTEQTQGTGIVTHKFRTAHADLEYATDDTLSLLTRYDSFEPSTDTGTGKVDEASLGVAFRSRFENSVLYIFGTKEMHQDQPQGTHRVQVIWRMTPAANSFRAAL
jgi:hypothetical protein